MQFVNLRIAVITGVPVPHPEGTNIFQYGQGEQYKPHYDFIFGPRPAVYAEDLKRGGQRIGTFYLNDGYEGGETAFPHLDWCFNGQAGDALLFWNVSDQGQLEEKSLHAGLPVTRGDKWLFSKWLREKPFR